MANISSTPEDTKPESLRNRLVSQSIEILETEGLQALSLRAAARGAGVSHMAPYRHFEDKEALLAAVAEAGFLELGAALKEAAARVDDGVERLRSIGIAYLHFAGQHPELYRLMFGSALPDKHRFPGLAEAAASAFSHCADAVAAISESSTGPGLDEEATAIAVWSMAHGLANLLLDGQLKAMRDEEVDDHLIERVLRVHAKAFE